MQSSKTFYILIISILISSCAKIYYVPNATNIAKSQQVIAIIPPTVSIAAKKKVEAEAIKEQQRTESKNFQKEIYAWMLKRKMQGKIKQSILDIETTNAKLAREGYPDVPFSPSEMAKILDVDGVLTSNFSMSKPMSEGAAVATAVLTGYYGTTNQIGVSIGIHDQKSRDLIWNYDHKFSGSVGSSTSQMVNVIMRKASKKMPYMR